MAEENSQTLYSCSSCTEEIPSHRARVSCHKCSPYHLCANCFVIKSFAPPHDAEHPTMVMKESGYEVPGAPGFPTRAMPPPLPPRRDSAASSPRQQPNRMTEMPTADWGSLWNIMKAPLEKNDKGDKKEKKGRMGGWMKDLGRASGSALSLGSGGSGSNENGLRSSQPPSNDSSNALPHLPSKSVQHGMEHVGSTMPSYPEPANWEPLFEADGTPKPIFVALMSALFSSLDPDQTGYLSPEVYSSFLDMQGTNLHQNTWKLALERADGDQCKDVADLELSLYFAELNISYELNIRSKIFTPVETSEQPPSSTEQRIKDSMTFSASMPMLSRQGFIDLSAVEYLKDPAKGHEELATAVSMYGIWEDLGEIPRNVLPESAVVKVTAENKSKSKAEEQDLYGADETKTTTEAENIAPAKEEVEKNAEVDKKEEAIKESDATEKAGEVTAGEPVQRTVEAHL